MPQLEPLLDKAYLGLKLKNNIPLFHLIYERHRASMLFYAGKHVTLDVAEDLVQDVFMQLWNNRNEIEITEKISGYLFKALRHHILDYFSKESSATKYLDALRIFALTFSSENADDKVREQFFLEGIYILLKNFNPQYIEIFKLRVQGYSNPEIAAQLGISEKTVRNQYSIIIKYLKDKMPYLILFLLSI